MVAEELFDTTVLIHYLQDDDPHLKERAEKVLAPVLRGERIASFSPLTIVELHQGIGLTPKQEASCNIILRCLEEAALFTAAALRVGKWFRGKDEEFRKRYLIDALIAATAEARGEPVRTRNVKHFKRFYAQILTY